MDRQEQPHEPRWGELREEPQAVTHWRQKLEVSSDEDLRSAVETSSFKSLNFAGVNAVMDSIPRWSNADWREQQRREKRARPVEGKWKEED